MPNNMRVALYCRVACADDNAIALQELMLQSFAQEQGYGNIGVYSDNGYSGLNFIRPAFMQMETDIQAGLIDMVLVKDLSRISRNTFDAYDWIVKIQSCGVSVKTLYEDDVNMPFIVIKSALTKAF